MSNANSPSQATEVRTVEFPDGDQTVTVTKLVSMGELLLVERGTDQLRLDAMLLEAISWQQDASGLAEFVATPDVVLGDTASSYDNPLPNLADPFAVSNEYTTIKLGVVDTGKVDGLLLKSERGASILGPATLGALTTIDSTRELSQWFRTPIGPEADL
jgi:hypothetical protein